MLISRRNSGRGGRRRINSHSRAKVDSVNNNSNMICHIFILLLAIIASVRCLSDVTLGQYAELSASFDTNSHSRIARDATTNLLKTSAKWMPPYKYCCGGANNTEYTKSRSVELVERYLICGKEAKAKKEQLDEWTKYGNPTKDPFDCVKMKKIKSDAHCLADCMMKKRGALNDDDTINTEVIKNVYRNELTSDWILELAMSAVDKCATNKGNTWIKQEPGMECSPRAANFYHCIWSEIITKCPEEQYNKNDYCTRVRTAFQEAEN